MTPKFLKNLILCTVVFGAPLLVDAHRVPIINEAMNRCGSKVVPYTQGPQCNNDQIYPEFADTMNDCDTSKGDGGANGEGASISEVANSMEQMLKQLKQTPGDLSCTISYSVCGADATLVEGSNHVAVTNCPDLNTALKDRAQWVEGDGFVWQETPGCGTHRHCNRRSCWYEPNTCKFKVFNDQPARNRMNQCEQEYADVSSKFKSDYEELFNLQGQAYNDIGITPAVQENVLNDEQLRERIERDREIMDQYQNENPIQRCLFADEGSPETCIRNYRGHYDRSRQLVEQVVTLDDSTGRRDHRANPIQCAQCDSIAGQGSTFQSLMKDLLEDASFSNSEINSCLQ